jgi:hypothetical protein
MEGSSHPRKQAEVERDQDLSVIRLTREQEEEAFGQVRAFAGVRVVLLGAGLCWVMYRYRYL